MASKIKQYVESIRGIPVHPPTTVCSITMKPPVSGYILLTATATVTVFGDSTRCVFGLGNKEGTTNLHKTEVGILDGDEKKRRNFNATSIDLYGPVTSAVTYTFYVTAHKDSVFNKGDINLSYVHFTAVFIEGE